MNQLQQQLVSKGLAKPVKSRRNKAKKRRLNLVRYQDVPPNHYILRFGKAYVKISDAYSVRLNNTGKEAIFLPHELVEDKGLFHGNQWIV